MNDKLCDIGRRLTTVLNESSKFWVEAQEVDGGNIYRMTVSDSGTGEWFGLEAELTKIEEL